MVSNQTNSWSAQVAMLELNLQRLSRRIADMPVDSIFLSRLMLNLGRGMSAMLEQQLRPFGLAEADFRVLMTLYSQPDGVANPSELCAPTAQSPANMSRIADALVSRELITRVPSQHDRRRMVLRVSEQGEALVQRLLPTLFAPLCELFSIFGAAEQTQMIGQLKRLGAKLDELEHFDAERAG